MKYLKLLVKKIQHQLKARKLSKLKRAPKLFIPTVSPWQIVIPFKPLSVLLILVLLAASSFLFLRSDIFLVKEIKVEEENANSSFAFVLPEQIKTGLVTLVARSILTISPDEVDKILRQNFLAIKTVRIEKKLPDQLVVYYQEREPVAVIKSEKISEQEKLEKDEQGEEVKKIQKTVSLISFFVDEDGLIFAVKEEKSDLPEFELASGQELKIGEKIGSRKTLDAIAILHSFQVRADLKIEKINLSKDSPEIEVIFSGPFVVLFETEGKKIEEQISSLQLIYHQAKIDGRKLQKVDFRYEYPVIS